jgi:hypothetical protein
MAGRMRAFLLILPALILALAGCGSAATPGAPGGSLPVGQPTGTPPPSPLASPSAAATEMLSLAVGDTIKTLHATCVITEGASIVIEAKDGADAVTFTWLASKAPEIGGTLGGRRFFAPGLAASVSFMSARSWSFDGIDGIESPRRLVSGTAICK